MGLLNCLIHHVQNREIMLVHSHIILAKLTLVFENVILQSEELHSFVSFSLQCILLLFHELHSV